MVGNDGLNMKLMSFLLLASIVFFSSCSSFKKNAYGPDGRLVVFADSATIELLQPGLKGSLAEPIYTLPQIEPFFDLEYQPIGNFNRLQDRAYLVFLGSLTDSTYTSRLIRQMLSPEILSRVTSGEQYVFFLKNRWANRQLIAFVVGDSLHHVNDILIREKAILQQEFNQLTNERSAIQMFRKKSQPKLQQQMADKLGFSVAFQHDYIIIRDSIGPNWFYMKRAQYDLDRWLWIHWWDAPQPEFDNFDQFITKRNQLTAQFIHSDDGAVEEVVKNMVQHKEVDFLGNYAIETRGLWRLSDFSMGGPFISYTFWNDSLNQMFMISGNVLAPKFQSKREFIREIEIIAKTFRFGSQQSSESTD